MAHWVTPAAIDNDGKLTTIGEIDFGVESRMFVFAFRDTDTNENVTETSIPVYNKLVELTNAEKAAFNGDQYIFIEANKEADLYDTGVALLLYDNAGVLVDTGLHIESNGQVRGRLAITDQSKEIIFKVEYTDPTEYTIGTSYGAYSHVYFNGRLFKLKSGETLPHRAEDGAPNDSWEDIGTYQPQYSELEAYEDATTYLVHSQVKHNGNRYKLSDKVATHYLTVSATPDMSYWNDIGAYNSEQYNPTVEHSAGVDYDVNDYVSYGGYVYICTVAHTSPITAPDPANFDIVGPVTIVGDYADATLYELNDLVKHNSRVYTLQFTQPYTTNTADPDLTFWTDEGAYTPGANTDQYRLFRILINRQNSGLVTFDVTPELGAFQIGQQLGETVNKDITKTTDRLMSYYVNDGYENTFGVPYSAGPDGRYYRIPKGIEITADGKLAGTPIGPEGDYVFDVVARNSIGLAKSQNFELTITSGYKDNTISAHLRPRYDVEREWFDMISSNAFNDVQFYRPTDPNYGLQEFPRILLKNNLAGVYKNTALDFETLTLLLKHKMNDHDAIRLRIGNMRYRTALDSNGDPLYDVLYKEILPVGQSVFYDPNAKAHTDYDLPVLDIFKQRLVDYIGSDDTAVSVDITRGLLVTNGATNYWDELPLWMINPQEDQGATPGLTYALPVAYLQPGQAEVFVNAAISYGGMHEMFYDKILTCDAVELKHHNSETHDHTNITLRCD